MVKTGRGPDKLQRLVDDFAQTCLSQSIEVPQSMIEHGLRDRIDQVAQHLGITSTAALHIYVDESWGRVMAEQFCADIDVGEARLAAAPDAILAVGFLGRLVLYGASDTRTAAGLLASAPVRSTSGRFLDRTGTDHPLLLLTAALCHAGRSTPCPEPTGGVVEVAYRC